MSGVRLAVAEVRHGHAGQLECLAHPRGFALGLGEQAAAAAFACLAVAVVADALALALAAA